MPALLCSFEKACCSPSEVRAFLAPLFQKWQATLAELLKDAKLYILYHW